MSRNRAKYFQGPFVGIEKAMMTSPAYKALSAQARDTYTLLKLHQNHPDQNEVIFTYAKMEEYGKHRHTFARAIRKLEKFGFIDVRQRGGLYRRTNIFKFSYRWKEITKDMVKSIKGAKHSTVKKGSERAKHSTPRGKKGEIIELGGAKVATVRELSLGVDFKQKGGAK